MSQQLFDDGLVVARLQIGRNARTAHLRFFPLPRSLTLDVLFHSLILALALHELHQLRHPVLTLVKMHALLHFPGDVGAPVCEHALQLLLLPLSVLVQHLLDVDLLWRGHRLLPLRPLRTRLLIDLNTPAATNVLVAELGLLEHYFLLVRGWLHYL